MCGELGWGGGGWERGPKRIEESALTQLVRTQQSFLAIFFFYFSPRNSSLELCLELDVRLMVDVSFQGHMSTTYTQ